MKSDKQKALETFFKEQSEEKKILNQAKNLTEETFKEQMAITLLVINWLREVALGFKIATLKEASTSLYDTANILENYYKTVALLPFENLKKLFDETLINRNKNADVIAINPIQNEDILIDS